MILSNFGKIKEIFLLMGSMNYYSLITNKLLVLHHERKLWRGYRSLVFMKFEMSISNVKLRLTGSSFTAL